MRRPTQRSISVIAALLALWSLLASSAGGRDSPDVDPGEPPHLVLEDTDVRTVRAESNGVTYKLYIRVPPVRPGSVKTRLPVVYLLDADYSFLLARNITEHLADRGHLTHLILVGVAYDGPLRYRLNRTRDYTPFHVATGGYGAEYQKVSGGGPAFATALEKAIIPFVEKHYPASGDRTLVGHSYGGLFASWMLVTRPSLFERYIIVSPSLWYADEMMFDLEAKRARGREDLAARVYFGVGAREVNRYDMPELLVRFVGRLRARRYPSLEIESRVWPEETHNSIFPLALSSGLRFVHEGR